MSDIPVPTGLHELLQTFVVNVLRQQPSDLIEYASTYFGGLLHNRDQGRSMDGEQPRVCIEENKNTSSDFENDFMDEAEEMAMLARRPLVSRRKSVCGEKVDIEDFEGAEERVVHPKSDEQRQRLSKAISNLLIFSSLDDEQHQLLLDAMFEREVVAGEHVIDEGDDGDNFYVVERGDFDIFKKDPSSGTSVHKGSYNGSGAFGELALMYNCPRAATIIAATDGSLWALDRTTFSKIIVRNAAGKRKKYEKFLKTMPILSTLTIEERSKVADAISSINYKKGEAIINQGDIPDYFYIVLEGKVRITKSVIDSHNVEKIVELATYGPGDFFGELALITKNLRAATATAVEDCTCAVLDLRAFERLLGPCIQLLKRNIPLYEQQLELARNVTEDL